MFNKTIRFLDSIITSNAFILVLHIIELLYIIDAYESIQEITIGKALLTLIIILFLYSTITYRAIFIITSFDEDLRR